MIADRWHTTLRAKSLSANTERTYLYTARRWSEWLAARGLDLDPAEVRAHHTEDFIADIIEATSPANGAHHYRNLRVYFGWLTKREKIPTGNPMDDTEPPRVVRKLIPILTEEDQAKVFATCDGRDFAAVRDKSTSPNADSRSSARVVANAGSASAPTPDSRWPATSSSGRAGPARTPPACGWAAEASP